MPEELDPTLPADRVHGQHTDAIRLYNLGRWGEKGYAVPWATRDFTNNKTIAYLVRVTSKNLFAAMHMPDAMVTSPPRKPALIHVHKSVLRFRQIISSRLTMDNELPVRPVHATPPQLPFVIHPTPYWRARNPWMQHWAGLILETLAEAMQHQDNVYGTEIGEEFARIVSQNARLVYNQLAVEFFGKSKEQVNATGFELTEADFNSYDPDKFFTSTERVDSRAPLDWQETEDDLGVLAEGIRYQDLRRYLAFYGRDPAESGSPTGTPRSGGQSNTGEWPAAPQP